MHVGGQSAARPVACNHTVVWHGCTVNDTSFKDQAASNCTACKMFNILEEDSHTWYTLAIVC